MNTQNQLLFLSQKIIDLKTAILTHHSDSLLLFPSAVVDTISVDESGCVWVAINKPMQYVNEFDRSFHVSLNYYKKGKPFFLNTYGIAKVVNDGEDINQLTQNFLGQVQKDKLLLCIKILEANYYEKPLVENLSFANKLAQKFSSFFGWHSDNHSFAFNEQPNYA